MVECKVEKAGDMLDASLQPINLLKERLLLEGPGRMHHKRLYQLGQAPQARF